MVPWLWYTAPQYRFPFSGNLTQDISPDTSWFFGAIQPGAGDGATEKEIFDVASYGKQLGLITEVLLSIADEKAVDAKTAEKSLQTLRALHEKIETVKHRHRYSKEEAATDLLEKMKTSDPDGFNRVLARFHRARAGG